MAPQVFDSLLLARQHLMFELRATGISLSTFAYWH